MGLDMFLEAEHWISSDKKEIAKQVADIVGATKFLENNIPYMVVNVQVAYWRKANAIHKWFVDNIQDGEDECQRSYVSRKELQTLIDLCNQAIKKPKQADKILPSSAGFFFGGTDYNEDYRQILQYTADRLTTLLETVPEDWRFYYQASW